MTLIFDIILGAMCLAVGFFIVDVSTPNKK
jgi:hypothetical protein